ncbi:MAG: hypothetical protein FWG50_12970 [Kiritimatiellaeota bacterium]|nr:hypothetical protein [Kiritimatiellota bacterium]
MKKLLLTTTCALLGACALHAEPVWLGTLEVDSLQALQSGVEAFCKAAQIPLPIPPTADLVKGILPLASPDAAISLKDPVRVFVVGDGDQPLSEPGLVFSVALPPNAKALQDQLAQLYGARREAGNVVTFSTPGNPGVPPDLLLSIADGNKALLASSKEALAWVQQQTKLDAFLPMPGNQMVRMCVNVKHATGMMPPLPTGQPNPLAAILGDVDYLSVAINPDAKALALSYGIRAKAGSVLGTVLDAFKPPEAALWNGLPADALFAYAGPESKSEDAQKFVKAYLQQDVPLDAVRAKLEKALTGDVVRYLVPTQDKKGLRLIDVNPVKDAAAVKEIFKTLDQSETPGVKFKKEEGREVGGQTIERYSMTIDMATLVQNAMQQGAAANGVDPRVIMGDPNVVMGGTLLTMLAKSIICEFTVKDNYAISAISPAGATDNWLPTLPFPAAATALDKKIAALDPAAKTLLGASEVRLMPLLKQIVSMFPNVKPQHLNLFPATTEALQFWTTRAADNTLVTTIRVPASEVAAVVKMTQQDMSVFQELFVTIFAAQMQQMMMPPAAVPPPNF